MKRWPIFTLKAFAVSAIDAHTLTITQCRSRPERDNGTDPCSAILRDSDTWTLDQLIDGGLNGHV